MSNFTVDPKAFGKVAVLMGGMSAEREISFMSGNATLEALKGAGVDAHGIDVQWDIVSVLSQNKFDRAFIALHGKYAEDGLIQGVLELLKIPYTGSGVLASALAMDKVRCKEFWMGQGLPTLPYELLDENSDAEHIVEKLGLPLIVKPVSEGSSIGVTKVNNAEELMPAVVTAREYDDVVMVEPFIQGGDYDVSILEDKAYPVIKIETPGEFYDYQAKYFRDDTRFLLPAGLTEEEEKQLQDLALRAFQTIGCRHWGRVDTLRDSKGQFWLMELNTIPGLTSHSLVPMSVASKGIDFNELILRILAQTLESPSRT